MKLNSILKPAAQKGEKDRDMCDIILFAMFAVSSLVVVQICGMALFSLLWVLFCAAMFISERKIYFCRYTIINFIFVELGVTAISACIGDMRYSYKKAAVYMTVAIIPLYFAATYIFKLLQKNGSYIGFIIKAVKVMCIMQLCWIPVQYILYRYADIDINRIIFTDILHMTEKASFYRDGIYYPSGFSWHSASLAPMFVLAFALFDDIIIRALILFDVMICGNSTSLVGVLLCAFGLAVFRLIKNRTSLKPRKRTVIEAVVLLVIAAVVLMSTDLLGSMLNSVVYLWNRLFSGERDSSTSAHLAFFTDYLEIVKNSTPFRIFFGYGYGCSGYPITMMYGRFDYLSSWVIECDIIDILVSRGIVGFAGYYYFLFYIAIKGLKTDYRYFVVMMAIIIQGIGYNVQWNYIFLLEMVMFFTLKLDINFFQRTEKTVARK